MTTQSPPAAPRTLYVGSYAGTITTLAVAEDGTLSPVSTVEGVGAPSFLAAHPNGRFLYAVDEAAEGAVTAFAIDAGRLTKLNSRPTGGSITAHLTVDPTGKHLLSANYGDGSVAVHPLEADGSIGEGTDLKRHHGTGPDTGRQEGAHAHVVRFAPDGRFALVADLGTDEVYAYEIDGGRLRQAAITRVPPGTGPRHLVFGPEDTVYLVGELDSGLHTFGYDAAIGALAEHGARPATVDSYPDPNYPSEVALSADGPFCYVANRGADVVSVFDVRSGKTKPVKDVPCGGQWPRHLATAGDWLWVANQHSDTLATFRLENGVPEPQGQPMSLSQPACVLPA